MSVSIQDVLISIQIELRTGTSNGFLTPELQSWILSIESLFDERGLVLSKTSIHFENDPWLKCWYQLETPDSFIGTQQIDYLSDRITFLLAVNMVSQGYDRLGEYSKANLAYKNVRQNIIHHIQELINQHNSQFLLDKLINSNSELGYELCWTIYTEALALFRQLEYVKSDKLLILAVSLFKVIEKMSDNKIIIKKSYPLVFAAVYALSGFCQLRMFKYSIARKEFRKAVKHLYRYYENHDPYYPLTPSLNAQIETNKAIQIHEVTVRGMLGEICSRGMAEILYDNGELDTALDYAMAGIFFLLRPDNSENEMSLLHTQFQVTLCKIEMARMPIHNRASMRRLEQAYNKMIRFTHKGTTFYRASIEVAVGYLNLSIYDQDNSNNNKTLNNIEKSIKILQNMIDPHSSLWVNEKISNIAKRWQETARFLLSKALLQKYHLTKDFSQLIKAKNLAEQAISESDPALLPYQNYRAEITLAEIKIALYDHKYKNEVEQKEILIDLDILIRNLIVKANKYGPRHQAWSLLLACKVAIRQKDWFLAREQFKKYEIVGKKVQFYDIHSLSKIVKKELYSLVTKDYIIPYDTDEWQNKDYNRIINDVKKFLANRINSEIKTKKRRVDRSERDKIEKDILNKYNLSRATLNKFRDKKNVYDDE